MIQLKEALIGKNTIKNAESLSFLYCVANYDDDLDLVGDDIMTVRSKDWVTIYILSEEAMNRHLKEIDDMLCDIWSVKDPSLSIKDVRKKIINNVWREDLDRKLCERVYLRTVKEALIGKHNEKKFSSISEVYCMAVSRNDIQDEILKDKNTEFFTWDVWGVLFIPDDKIQYWIDYCKKEIPRLGWWAGKIHAHSRDEAKKLLIHCKDKNLNDIIEKIEGPSKIW